MGRLDRQRRAQCLAILLHLQAQGGRQLLPLQDRRRAHIQQLLQHKAQPLMVDGRIGAGALLVIGPLLIGQAQATARLGLIIFGIQAMGEGILQHRQAQEGARDFNQGQPVGMMAGNRLLSNHRG
ncbi:hypothetical protein [Dictyobacter formicarum]|uniref:hypothetical protein n=1 Tax=Dictyobacter formicarum TaxID=2778368 RepID=UPI0019159E3D|nr:hypothetical protein [Dictyobacter formicarum]